MNWNLSVYLFLLIFGVVSYPVFSVKCYSCKESACNNYKVDGKEIECEHGCERIKTPEWTERRCAPLAKEVECFKKEVGGCLDMVKEELIAKCVGEKSVRKRRVAEEEDAEEEDKPGDQGFRCLCTVDLCNGEIKLEIKTPESRKRNEEEEDEDGVAGCRSNYKIILGFLVFGIILSHVVSH